MYLYSDVHECRLSKNIYKLQQLYCLSVSHSIYNEYSHLSNDYNDCKEDMITIFDSKSINDFTNYDEHELIKNDEMLIFTSEYSEKWSPKIPKNIKKLRICGGVHDSSCKKEYFNLFNLPETLEYIEFYFDLSSDSQYNLTNIPINVNTIQINIGKLINNSKIKYYNYKTMPSISHPHIDLIKKTKSSLKKYIDTLKIPFGCKIIINDMNQLSKYEYIM
jgi:hypothetical protein